MNYSLCFPALFVLFATVGCTKPQTGSESGPCYANATCNDALICLSNTCVNALADAALPTGDAASTDAAMSSEDLSATDAAGNVNDAGMPCPGASIFHPGTESRQVGTVVPFVGRGRDPSCAALTGAKLVWTDSLEGQIGTGEMFNHTFTVVGSHTVTLAAKDGGNTYNAMVTFAITL